MYNILNIQSFADVVNIEGKVTCMAELFLSTFVIVSSKSRSQNRALEMYGCQANPNGIFESDESV